MIFFYSNHPDDLSGLDLLNTDSTALLYQTGYLTISDYDADSNRVRLKVPNEEEVCDRPPPSLQDIGVNFSSETRRIEGWKIE